MPNSVPHSKPSKVRVDGVELMYDTFGAPSNMPMLLIMGLGEQMISWEEELCTQIAFQGYWVIRFDNRDVGLSTKFDYMGTPNVLECMKALIHGEQFQAPYTLRDMAEDSVGLLSVLDIDSAHIVGVSMGGMIAQLMAIHHPERVRTLTSIMSSTGHPDLPSPRPEVLSLLTQPTPTDREGVIKRSLEDMKLLHGDQLPFDEDHAREHIARAYDRGLHPPGFARQLAAILASGSRRDALQSISIPTLVIHGDADPLVPIEGGIDTAESIPGATLFVIKGMGHGLPRTIWPQMIEAITQHAV